MYCEKVAKCVGKSLGNVSAGFPGYRSFRYFFYLFFNGLPLGLLIKFVVTSYVLCDIVWKMLY
jgi:hypothetical protein